MQVLVKEWNFNLKYFEQLQASMSWLGKKSDTMFIGQAVGVPGTGMYNTLNGMVDKSKLYELPVVEEMQMGMSLGLSLSGKVVISIFPRWNFLLCGMNQLVNHIDKFPAMAPNWKKKNLIIRTSVGSERPLFPQYQHIGDYSDMVKNMAPTIKVIKLNNPDEILKSYKDAYNAPSGTVSLIVEFGDFYNEK